MYACMYAEIETDGDEEEDTIQPATLEEKLVCFGPYNPPAGWTVLPIPSGKDFEDLEKNVVWGNKKLAHLSDDGWREGVFRRKEMKKKKWTGRYDFYYHYDRREFPHELRQADYGERDSWVIIEEDSKRRAKMGQKRKSTAANKRPGKKKK